MTKPRWLVITALYVFVVGIGSLIPDYTTTQKPLWQIILHNSLHVPAYGFMTILLLRVTVLSTFSRKYFATFIIAWLYGAWLETLQMYVPGRDASVLDLALNALGAWLGLSLFRSSFVKRTLLRLE